MSRDLDLTSIAMSKALTIQTCRVCGRPKYQKHAETCPGPPPEPECDCPPGWKHLPDCVLVTGDEAA